MTSISIRYSIVVSVLFAIALLTSVAQAQTVDTQPPSIPTGLVANSVSASQINLGWATSTDDVAVAGYHVYRNGTLIENATSTWYSNTGLSAATTYTYAIAAFDVAGNTSAQSASASATTLPAPPPPTGDTQAPSTPTGLLGSTISQTQINLTWIASTDNVGVVGYRIYRNSAQIGTATTAMYSDTGLIGGTTYLYSVSAYDAAGNVSAKSLAFSARTSSTVSPPPAPTGLTAIAASPNQINLSWLSTVDLNVSGGGYNVYRNGVKLGWTVSKYYSDMGLTPGTTYTYTVELYDSYDNRSPQSAPASATTPTSWAGDTQAPAAPQGVFACEQCNWGSHPSYVEVVWYVTSDNIGVTGYDVYRNGIKVGTVAAEMGNLYYNYNKSYLDGTTKGYTSYTYTVRAFDAAGNISAMSSPTTIITSIRSGATVKTTSKTTVYDNYRKNSIGSQAKGVTGTVTDGPVYEGNLNRGKVTKYYYVQFPTAPSGYVDASKLQGVLAEASSSSGLSLAALDQLLEQVKNILVLLEQLRVSMIAAAAASL